jgi:hypothetical protein
MRLTLGLFTISAVVFGQDLRISSASAAPGREVRIEVSLESPPGKEPVALQWEMIFPSQLLDPQGDGPEIGGAEGKSDKSVACALQKPYSYTCVLFGGQKPIANDLKIIFNFKIRSDARLGPTAIRIQKAEAATADFRRSALKDAEGTLTIR